MNELSLFTGYGGFSLALRLAGLEVKTVGYVEIDEYCQQIIQARIEDGHLDPAPIIRDIRSCDFRPMAGLVDIVTGGFPCQPHSVAGQRRGEADERNLWPDTLRVISEVGPRIVLLENVPGLAAAKTYNVSSLERVRQQRLFDTSDHEPSTRHYLRRDFTARGLAYMGTVVGELSEIGYDAEWHFVPAAGVGAPHLRDRWWCLGYAQQSGLERRGI